jgi:hypothetical protein
MRKYKFVFAVSCLQFFITTKTLKRFLSEFLSAEIPFYIVFLIEINYLQNKGSLIL